jgi:hypothetical protein
MEGPECGPEDNGIITSFLTFSDLRLELNVTKEYFI